MDRKLYKEQKVLRMLINICIEAWAFISHTRIWIQRLHAFEHQRVFLRSDFHIKLVNSEKWLMAIDSGNSTLGIESIVWDHCCNWQTARLCKNSKSARKMIILNNDSCHEKLHSIPQEVSRVLGATYGIYFSGSMAPSIYMNPGINYGTLQAVPGVYLSSCVRLLHGYLQ